MRLLEAHFDRILRSENLRKEDITFVEITGPAREMFLGNPKEYWDHREFGSCVPPTAAMWLEFAMPSGLNSEGEYKSFAEMTRRYPGLRSGALVLTSIMDESESEQARYGRFIGSALREIGAAKGGKYPEGHIKETVAEFTQKAETLYKDEGLYPKWMSFLSFFHGNDRVLMQNNPGCIYHFDQTGVPMPTLSLWLDTDPLHSGEEWYQSLIEAQTLPFLYSLSIMHCKNVELQPEPRLPSAIKKKRIKRGKRVLRYQVIHVNKMGAGAGRRGSNGKRGPGVAFHVTRGHFRTYTEEKPLFGKYHGKFWIPSHVKGDMEEGQIVSSYKVHGRKGEK